MWYWAGSYQLINQRDQGLQVFFNREMELVFVLEIDGDYRIIAISLI